MAYQPIEEEAKFQTKLRRLEPTDPDHADTFNPLFETLLNNDVFLNQETDKVKEHCENNSVHVTTEQKEQWSQIVTPQQDGQMTKEDKLKLDGIEKGAQENQDAFGEIRIGSTSIAANKKDASITLKAGANIELKGDNSTKTLEIKAQNATDASEMTYQNPHQAGGNTTDLETVLNYIADKVLHKLIEKSDIIQNTQISDTTKIPSSVVTKNLQEQITQLNNNLTRLNTICWVYSFLLSGVTTDENGFLLLSTDGKYSDSFICIANAYHECYILATFQNEYSMWYATVRNPITQELVKNTYLRYVKVFLLLPAN